MVQILRQGGGPQTVTVTGPKKGVLQSLLEPAAEGFSRGLGQGLSESFQDYFEEQREKKYNSIIDEELAKYAQEEGTEGEATPRQMIRAATNYKLPIREKDRENLMDKAQTMAVVERNQQLEEAKSKSISPDQEEAAIRVIQSLDPNEATEADVYNALRTNAGLNARQAKIFVDEIWKPRKKSIEDQYASELRSIDKEIADLNAMYTSPGAPDKTPIKKQIDAKLLERSKLVQSKRKKPSLPNSPGQGLMQKGMNLGIASREQGRQGQQFPPPMMQQPQVSQGPTGPSTIPDDILRTAFQ